MNSGRNCIKLEQAEEFVQAMARHQRSILLYIHTLIPNWSDAEDVLQNTNIVLWRKCNDFKPGTSFYRWACAVARFEVLKWRDRQSKDAKVFGAEFVEEIADELLHWGDQIEQRHHALMNCLGKLRDRDRQLIMLRYRDGETTKSVSEQLNRPIKSIYAAVNRIRDRLLECINRVLSQEDASPSPALGDQ